ncbi:hypothetical protein WJX79_007883 [Trebouxia sp. C0005]
MQIHLRKQWVHQIIIVREKTAFAYIRALNVRIRQERDEEKKTKTKEELKLLRAARLPLWGRISADLLDDPSRISLSNSPRRGRAPADNSDVLAMFCLVYSGEGATQPLVDDSSLTKEQKWQLLFDRNWQNLAPLSQTKWLVYLRNWKKWIDDHPEQPEGYVVFPSSKISAFLSHILADCTASNSKDPHGAVKSARKALRHLRACQAGIPDDEAKFPSQPYIAGVTSRAKTATAEARQCEEADPSCSASTLSNEEYASLLDAAMCYPDKQVGLCVAAMILALANNAGKANQDAQMTYAVLANHRQPHLDCLAYLSQLVLYQINVSRLPLLALIHQKNMSWRSYRMFFRDPSMATSKQTY